MPEIKFVYNVLPVLRNQKFANNLKAKRINMQITMPIPIPIPMPLCFR